MPWRRGSTTVLIKPTRSWRPRERRYPAKRAEEPVPEDAPRRNTNRRDQSRHADRVGFPQMFADDVERFLFRRRRARNPLRMAHRGPGVVLCKCGRQPPLSGEIKHSAAGQRDAVWDSPPVDPDCSSNLDYPGGGGEGETAVNDREAFLSILAENEDDTHGAARLRRLAGRERRA